MLGLTGPDRSEILKCCWSWSELALDFLNGSGPVRDQPIWVRGSLVRTMINVRIVKMTLKLTFEQLQRKTVYSDTVTM